ncbi:MAG: DNA methyltransferase [Anaerolineales bacterium]|nr:DNA methyltransferase [Anaerolineales bacterium]MDW8446765.1 DNA methyltransferase [Anaerolineales bacterium]
MICELDWQTFSSRVSGWKADSLDFILLMSAAIPNSLHQDLSAYLAEIVRVLKPGGLLFVHGLPETLPALGVALDRLLTFKYWIVIESSLRDKGKGLPTKHTAVLLFSKGKSFRIRQLRFPHQLCKACGRSLRDWGGKSHLMNPEGYLISDVWKDIPHLDNYEYLSPLIQQFLIRLLPQDEHEVEGVIVPKHIPISHLRQDKSLGPSHQTPRAAETTDQYACQLPLFSPCCKKSEESGKGLWNVVLQGDILEKLRQYPDQSVDLVFADPPYNLDKAYSQYEDERSREEYLEWCNSWLDEYVRILKPTGSLYLLNLPRWAMYHAVYLNRKLYFQNWIVWDALSEPRGKIMPAHYALLFYTRHPTDFTFNYEAVSPIDARFYCLRQGCIRERKRRGIDEKEPLTDIWWDIHRLKHRRNRDFHPCQLPDALLERIILLSTNPGDIVVDALAGTGTTAVAAAKLGRRYVAIDIDFTYVEMTRQKIAQVETLGKVYRQGTKKAKNQYSKKALQIELREIARQLGRLPTPEDVQRLSRYGLEAFLETFPSWSKALKAAKIEVNHAKSTP